MRVFLTIVLPLLTPSLLYVLWLIARARLIGSLPAPSASPGDAAQQPAAPHFIGDNVPWVTLTLSGAVLAIGVTMAVYLTQPVNRPHDIYIPPRFENGHIVPGESIPRSAEHTGAPQDPSSSAASASPSSP